MKDIIFFQTDTYMNTLQQIIDNVTCPVFVAEPQRNQDNQIIDFKIAFTNEKMKKIAGTLMEKSNNWSVIKNFIEEDVPWLDIILGAINKTKIPEASYYSPSAKGWFKIEASAVNENFIVVTLVDITSEKNYFKQFQESLIRDSLTGLLNRSGLKDTITEVIENCGYNNTYAAILTIDIDNLKSINDSKGAKAGDSIIIQVAEILKRFERDNIKVFRYGDDEFLVLISEQPSADSITTITDTIYESFQQVQLSVSGGISVFPDHTDQKDDLLRFADMAIHYAKKIGRNNFTFFEMDMQKQFIQNLTIQSRLSSAIMDNNFTQCYQPQFDVKTGELRGFEALIRWHDEELGDVPPSIFIPLAEESGLIIPIGKWVLNTALATLKRWQDNYNFKGIMSVNISPIQLRQEGFVYELKALIDKYEINPDLLEVEITEGVMIRNMEITIDKLSIIKDMGLRVSLDDFGTGYSSLSYLQALPLNTLKIDKSFINNITAKDGTQANITSSIINMVKKMGLETIAEGVERPEQLQMLSEFNCNIVQGYLRGKPMPSNLCDAYLGGDKSALLKND